MKGFLHAILTEHFQDEDLAKTPINTLQNKKSTSNKARFDIEMIKSSKDLSMETCLLQWLMKGSMVFQLCARMK